MCREVQRTLSIRPEQRQTEGIPSRAIGFTHPEVDPLCQARQRVYPPRWTWRSGIGNRPSEVAYRELKLREMEPDLFQTLLPQLALGEVFFGCAVPEANRFQDIRQGKANLGLCDPLRGVRSMVEVLVGRGFALGSHALRVEELAARRVSRDWGEEASMIVDGNPHPGTVGSLGAQCCFLG